MCKETISDVCTLHSLHYGLFIEFMRSSQSTDATCFPPNQYQLANAVSRQSTQLRPTLPPSLYPPPLLWSVSLCPPPLLYFCVSIVELTANLSPRLSSTNTKLHTYTLPPLHCSNAGVQVTHACIRTHTHTQTHTHAHTHPAPQV